MTVLDRAKQLQKLQALKDRQDYMTAEKAAMFDKLEKALLRKENEKKMKDVYTEGVKQGVRGVLDRSIQPTATPDDGLAAYLNS